MVGSIEAVDATLLAALIGGVAGVLGGVAGHYTAGRIARRDRRDERQLTDLIAVQDALVRLNRLHYRVNGFWTRGESPPDDLWEDYVGTRGEALALSHRITDDSLRKKVDGVRERLAVQPHPTTAAELRTELDAAYQAAQDSLGDAIRGRLR